MTATLATIDQAAVDRYGVRLLDLDPAAALWAAELHTLATGAPGWSTWRTVASYRARHGRATVLPGMLSPCWTDRA